MRVGTKDRGLWLLNQLCQEGIRIKLKIHVGFCTFLQNISPKADFLKMESISLLILSHNSNIYECIMQLGQEKIPRTM